MLMEVFQLAGSHRSLCYREIVDIHEKENALDIVTEDRIYHIVAESPEDARYKREFIIHLHSLLGYSHAAPSMNLNSALESPLTFLCWDEKGFVSELHYILL